MRHEREKHTWQPNDRHHRRRAEQRWHAPAEVPTTRISPTSCASKCCERMVCHRGALFDCVSHWSNTSSAVFKKLVNKPWDLNWQTWMRHEREKHTWQPNDRHHRRRAEQRWHAPAEVSTTRISPTSCASKCCERMVCHRLTSVEWTASFRNRWLAPLETADWPQQNMGGGVLY